MTRLLFFSDSHEEASFPRGLDKRVLGFCNSHFKRRYQHDPAWLKAAVDQILAERPDAVLFGGDAVSTADPREFERALPYFLPLVRSEIPFYCTAGNHDCYVRNSACRRAMLDFYAALGNADIEKPRCIRLNDLRLMILPESCPTVPWLSCGRLDDETIAAVTEEVEKNDAVPLIVAGHFPLRVDTWRRGLRKAEPLRQMLAERKIALSLCGHVHKPSFEDGEVIAGSVTRFGLMTEVLVENGDISVKRISLKKT